MQQDGHWQENFMFGAARRDGDMARDGRALHRSLLMAGIAEVAFHSINNMLMVLDASLEQMAQDAGTQRQPESKRLLEDMTQAAEQIGQATERFQSLSRPGASGDKHARLSQALQVAFATLRMAMPRSIRMEPMQENGEHDGVLTRMDAASMRYLAASLGLTARAALPRGGRAALDVRVGMGDASDADWPRSVELAWTAEAEAGANATLAASMATLDEAPNKAIRAGAEALAAESGARLEWIECRAGKVVASLKIPCRPVQESAPALASAAHATMILAAFDDYARGLTAAALRDLGHEVVCFGQVDRALAARASASAVGPTVMIVETNILTSATTEQLDQLEELGQTDHIIVVRGGTREVFADQLKTCSCLLDKPYSMGQLIALVNRALHAQVRKGSMS